VPKKELLGYLAAVPGTRSRVFSTSPDCYVREVSPGLSLASTVDFFYPLVDDAFTQGQIAAANVMSDLFAMGVTKVDHFLVVLGMSTKLSETQRTAVAAELMRGLEHKVAEAGAVVAGGQTVLNPWLLVGGSALGFFAHNQPVVDNCSARPGDLLLLTKPIGNQMIVNFAQYFRKDRQRAEKLLATGRITEAGFAETYKQGVEAMTRLNLPAAKVIARLGRRVRASTDVTGFGLRGHCDNLVALQKNAVNFVFDQVPVFRGLKDLDGVARDFKLKQGLAAETSGGLLVVVERAAAELFRKMLRDESGHESWVVGRVVEGQRLTVLDEHTEFFDA